MTYSIQDFTNYINRHKWKNAKTFENFAPHEYILSFPCEKTKAEGKLIDLRLDGTIGEDDYKFKT